jgi:DMSO/TMAO reductase YedYZ heme-binding membrane subunit
LRFGYVALALVMVHVFLLKSARWSTWYEGGMTTPPSLSLVVTIFAAVVILVRLLLWFSLSRRRAR